MSTVIVAGQITFASLFGAAARPLLGTPIAGAKVIIDVPRVYIRIIVYIKFKAPLPDFIFACGGQVLFCAPDHAT